MSTALAIFICFHSLFPFRRLSMASDDADVQEMKTAQKNAARPIKHCLVSISDGWPRAPRYKKNGELCLSLSLSLCVCVCVCVFVGVCVCIRVFRDRRVICVKETFFLFRTKEERFSLKSVNDLQAGRATDRQRCS